MYNRTKLNVSKKGGHFNGMNFGRVQESLHRSEIPTTKSLALKTTGATRRKRWSNSSAKAAWPFRQVGMSRVTSDSWTNRKGFRSAECGTTSTPSTHRQKRLWAIRHRNHSHSLRE